MEKKKRKKRKSVRKPKFDLNAKLIIPTIPSWEELTISRVSKIQKLKASKRALNMGDMYATYIGGIKHSIIGQLPQSISPSVNMAVIDLTEVLNQTFTFECNGNDREEQFEKALEKVRQDLAKKFMTISSDCPGSCTIEWTLNDHGK